MLYVLNWLLDRDKARARCGTPIFRLRAGVRLSSRADDVLMHQEWSSHFLLTLKSNREMIFYGSQQSV